VNYYRLWKATDSVPDGVTLETPDQHPIDLAELPEPLRAEIESYRRRHADEELALVKRMRTVNGEPVLVIEDDADLPDEDALVTFSIVEAVSSSEEMQVVTDLVVGRRARPRAR
jgi:hypothetical protein